MPLIHHELLLGAAAKKFIAITTKEGCCVVPRHNDNNPITPTKLIASDGYHFGSEYFKERKSSTKTVGKLNGMHCRHERWIGTQFIFSLMQVIKNALLHIMSVGPYKQKKFKECM